MEFCDRMAQDAEKMADAMMEVIKDMCGILTEGRMWMTVYFTSTGCGLFGGREISEKEEVKRGDFRSFQGFWRKKQYIKTEGRKWTLKEEGR